MARKNKQKLKNISEPEQFFTQKFSFYKLRRNNGTGIATSQCPFYPNLRQRGAYLRFVNYFMNKKSLRKNILAAFIIVFLVLFPHFVPLPFYSYAIVCLGVIIFYLRKQNKTLHSLGLKCNGLTARTFMVGIVSALLWVAFNRWVYHPFIINRQSKMNTFKYIGNHY